VCVFADAVCNPEYTFVIRKRYHPPMTQAFCVLAVVAILTTLPSAQPVFTGAEIFPPEEFAARRAKVMAAIGDGVAILEGTTERPGEQALRHNNQFF
jgi:hypothetical protein